MTKRTFCTDDKKLVFFIIYQLFTGSEEISNLLSINQKMKVIFLHKVPIKMHTMRSFMIENGITFDILHKIHFNKITFANMFPYTNQYNIENF